MIISDQFAAQLADQARTRQRSAHRPGTIQGRESALKLFMRFCVCAHVKYDRPAYDHICWYVEHLARAGYAPMSISNNISHLRTYFDLAGLDARPLRHMRVGLALRAIGITIRHVPQPKDPVPPALLKRALANTARLKSPEATKLAILLMYMGFLRQSSVAPVSLASFDPTRHLTSADVTPQVDGLRINLKWSKTLQSSADATEIMIPPTNDQVVCPVKAFTTYTQVAPPSSDARAPLLRHRDGNTLTVPYIRRQWATLLGYIGESPANHSLHSLRRGAAQFTYNDCRTDLNDVMNQGTWRSLAVRSYIRPAPRAYNTVHKALATI